MIFRDRNRFLLPVVAVILAGCASTIDYFSIGKQHLQKNEYDLAIQAFESARAENPDDPQILRELGIAHYQKIQFDKAIPLLIQAFLEDTTDGRTLFYLGTAYEITNDIPHAYDIYRRYVDADPASGMRKSIEARLTGLIRKQMAAEAKSVLKQESTINPAAIPDSSIAVLYFKNAGKKRDLDPIQKGMADMLITDLSKVKKLRVVERVRMQKMLDEIGLGKTGLVDPATAPRVGKLLGASKLVNGTFIDLSQDRLRIDAGLVPIKTDKPVSPGPVQGKLAQLFRMEKDLAFGILDKLGVKLTQAERDEIKIIPTENLLAFLAYCNGLDYEDKGMYKEARQQYQRAAQLDPHFTSAVQGSSRAEDLTLSQMPVSALEDLYVQTAAPATETAAATAPPPSATQSQEQSSASQDAPVPTSAATEPAQAAAIETPEMTGIEAPLVDQMMHTAEVLDQGFLPGIDSRKPTQEENQSSFGNSASFEIHVPLPQQ